MKRAFDMDRFQRRFAENLAAAQALASAAPKPEVGKPLTPVRPLLSESPARVAPMESEHMRNIETASAEIFTFPNMRAPVDGAVLALASMTLSGKATRRAAARCEKRVARARVRLRATAEADPGKAPAAVAAIGMLARTCATCGKCPITPPR